MKGLNGMLVPRTERLGIQAGMFIGDPKEAKAEINRIIDKVPCIYLSIIVGIVLNYLISCR